jgi:hypothetical protein
MSGGTTVERLVVGSGRMVRPLATALSDRADLQKFLRSFGFVLPDADADSVVSASGDQQDVLNDLLDALEVLARTDDSGAEDLAPVVARVPAALALVGGLSDTLQPLTGRLPTTFGGEVFDLLVVSYLAFDFETLHAAAVMLGLVEYRKVAADSTDPDARDIDYLRVTVHWSRMGNLLSRPADIPRDLYGWGGPDFAANLLLVRAQTLLDTLGVLATVEDVPEELLAVLWPAGAPSLPPAALQVPVWESETDDPSVDRAVAGLLLAAAGPATLDSHPGLALLPYVEGQFEAAIPLGVTYVLEVLGSAELAGGPVEIIRPDGCFFTAIGPVPVGDTSMGLRLRRIPTPGSPAVVLLDAEGVGLVAGSVFVQLTVSPEDAGVALGITGGQLGVIPSADGFLGRVLPRDGLQVPFDLTLEWTSRHGLRISGAAGLELTIQLGLQLGPVVLESVYLVLRPDADGVSLRVATSASFALGPFAATVDRVGIAANLRFPSDGGNLGPADLDIGFKPPTGVGIAIELPAVSGGGFLLLDPEAGQYAGVFELTIIGTISVKAIAIITTKLPGGRDGFALLVIITAEGFTPVPLGFGFSLTGIGGLLALNRSVDVNVVRNGLRDGVLDSVLFVKDPVKNAPRLISTLNNVFPLAPDRLVVGPLAEITWGTPPLVKIRLALLLEVPDPIKVALLAQLAVSLPTQETAIVELHVDAIGVLDFSRGELTLDASIHHSRLLCLSLSGDLALRLNWGTDPGFVMSVGGFHPKYRLPAGLRRLNRLSLSLTGTDNPRVKLETYLAITSNSIQMGARVQLYADAGGFGVDGGGAFDALIQWAPFHLDVSFEAWVRIFTPVGTLLGARVAVELTGPEPWHVTGLVEIHILFVAITVGVDFELGDSRARPPVETVDVGALLWSELSQPASWQATLPAGLDPGATLTVHAPSDDDLVIHPLSELTGRQRVAPLDTLITRVGARRPFAGPTTYSLHMTVPTGVTVDHASELFAPAQFTESTEDAKLSGPAFVPLHAGVRLRSDQAGGLPGDGIASSTVEVETLDVTHLDRSAVRGARVEANASDLAPSTGRVATARNLATMGAVLTP